MRLLPVLILLFIGLALPVARAERDPMAEPRFVTAGGTAAIVDGIVAALAQDDRGLIWVGTSVGLVRYDGYQARAFPMTGAADSGSRANRFLRVLLADRGGVLWAGSASEGLARFDTLTERWTFLHHDPAVPDSITPGAVQRLARAHDGRIWVGLLGGLDRLDPASGRFEHFRAGDASGLPDDRIGALLVDREGDLWVGTGHGLARLRAGGRRFEPIEGGWPVNALAQGADGRIWVGTRDGRLLLLDRDGRAAPQALQAGDAGGRPSPVLSLLGPAEGGGDGEVWVGRVTGVELRAADGSLLQLLKRNQRRPWTLGGTDFHALLRDRAGTLWVGGYGGGLQRYDPESKGMWVRRQDDDPASPLADTDVRSVLQLGSGEIWLGTLERGIAIVDPKLRLVDTIRPDARFSGLVAALAQAADGSVWAGTEGGQLYRFDARHRLLEARSSIQARVRRLLTDRAGTLWVGTSDGLYRLAPGAVEPERLPLAGGKRLGGNVNALVEGLDGRLWVGAEAGLFQLVDGELRADGAGLPQEGVLGLLIDAHGVLWADLNTGLYRRMPGAAFESVGRPGHSFGANLLADAKGRIWTHRGMFDPGTQVVTEFGRIDGVDIGTGWFRAYGKLADGRMLFGGSTGLLVVEPERFRRWAFQPPVVATGLRIDSSSQPAGLLREGLTLTARQRAFAVEFAALDYSAPTENLYRYRLQGYDEDWISTGAELRVASYANLAPGRYTLEVQGSNRLGDWTGQPLRVGVEVQPAWWQTWWARTLAVLLAVLGIYGLVQWRTRALERRQVELERRVQERTAELEALSEALKESSLSDPLTGLHNRRYLTQHIDADVAVALRRHAVGTVRSDNADLVFMLVDVDHFKQVNDRHGHSAGDAVLVQMRERLREVCRDSDHIVRWGGEEFLVVARDGSREHAADLAERLRRAVAGRPFELPDGQRLTRTCSIGFACFPLAPRHPQALDWSAVIDVADGALYEAKRGGRDRWVGVLAADPGLDADALRELLGRSPAQWLASERLRVLRGGQ
ncbi:diguanylate cyclase [Roseateles sp.]|uniref:diguanylate cyclase n=1 Tax=Roseateles sp. TaxID=1971397 RepID=UPI0025FD93DC|nr:diguanylate cyclase [Roseateles sp.]MBV8037436.1 diguanylate cyclase [Roseateles sp.]